MVAGRTGPLAQPDGAAEQFLRGFASCPGSTAVPQRALDGPEPAPGPHPEFRLTTVVPGVAVSIEVGGLSRPW